MSFHNMHWVLARMVDPVGKLAHDLNVLNFRRWLLHSMPPGSGIRICVHDGCVERFKNIEFFNGMGSEYELVPVSGREESEKHGASGFVCCCPTSSGELLASAGFEEVL